MLRLHLLFKNRVSLIFIGCRGTVVGPVAAAVARNVNVVGPMAVGAGSLAAAAGRDASVGAITEDGELVAGLADNATKLSQTGQTFPVQGCILGSTRTRM